MIHEGATPQRSAFLSSFFTLVGTHGLHVTFGLVWLVTLMVQVGKARPDPGQQAPADVPQHVLALPRRHLDRRLHLRLSAWECCDEHKRSIFSRSTAADAPRRSRPWRRLAAHATLKELSDRLRPSVVLNGHPVLARVMTGALGDNQLTAFAIMALAVVQIVVHMGFLPHMSPTIRN